MIVRMRPMTVRHLMAHGRVQGVGYRNFVLHEALALGVEGWVRNCKDGSVEILAAGEAKSVAALEAACRAGPAGAAVSSLEARDGDSASLRARRTGERFSVLPLL